MDIPLSECLLNECVPQIHVPVYTRYKNLLSTPTFVVWRLIGILKSVLDTLYEVQGLFDEFGVKKLKWPAQGPTSTQLNTFGRSKVQTK